MSGSIVVRHADVGEPLKLLDGSEATLDPSFVVIADEARPLAVAGVMGGLDSRVTDATRNIFLEAAHFAPSAIMGRARKLGLHTDASHRYERGVDPALPKRAMERATELILAIAGGKAGPVTVAERLEDLREHVPVLLRHARLRRVLGIEVAASEVARIFTALGMGVDEVADGWRITPPSSRFDIEREEDLIEEVARIHGYERIPTHVPAGEIALRAEPEARLTEMALRDQLAARGYFEAVTLSFVERRAPEDLGRGQGLGPPRQPAVGRPRRHAYLAPAGPGRGAAAQPRAPAGPRAPVRGRAQLPRHGWRTR